MTFPPVVACIFLALFGGACFCAGTIIGMTSAFDNWKAGVEDWKRRRERLNRKLNLAKPSLPAWWV